MKRCIRKFSGNSGIYFRCDAATRTRWEIRRISTKMLEIRPKEAPIMFDDFKIDNENDSAMLIES